MTRKVVVSTLALLLVFTTLAFGPLDRVAAQADNVSISLAGCTVGVSFVATQQTTYFFEVFDSGLLDEQSYTPFSPDDIPANVSFSFTYSGPLPAPDITIVLFAGDDVVEQFGVSGEALTVSCTPPVVASPPTSEPPPTSETPPASETPPDDAPVTRALPTCGPDLRNAVVGSFVMPAALYSAPGVPVEPWVGVAPGQTAWVLGLDASGEYYQILWGCQRLWVPAEAMGPNYDLVWNGMPLPTNDVENS